LVGVAVVYVVIKAPQIALMGIVSAILLDRLGGTGLTIVGLPLTASKLSMAVALPCWVVYAVQNRRPVLRPTPVTWGLVAVLLAMALSLRAFSADDDYAGKGFADMVSVTTLTIMLHYIYTSLDRRWFRQVSRAYAAATIVSLSLAALAALDPEVERASGAFKNPNEWGSVVVLASCVTLGVLAIEKPSPWRSLALLATLALAPVCVLLSASRGALAAGSLVALPMMWILRKDLKLMGLAAILAAAGLPFMGDLSYITGRIQVLFTNDAWGSDITFGASSVEGRVFLAELAGEVFSEHWLTGVGVGAFPRYSAEYWPMSTGRDPHNSYLQIAAEQGIVGVCAHLILAAMVIGVIYTVLTRAKTQQTRILSRCMTTGAMGYAVMNATSGKLMVFPIGYFSLGLLLALHRIITEDDEQRQELPQTDASSTL